MKTAQNSTVFRFLAVGLWNTAFGLILFTALLLAIGQSRYEVVFLVSSLISVIQAFFMQRFFVWKSTNRALKEFSRFATTYVLTIGLNFILLKTAVHSFNFSPLAAQYVITAALVISSYGLNKNWVFKVR